MVIYTLVKAWNAIFLAFLYLSFGFGCSPYHADPRLPEFLKEQSSFISTLAHPLSEYSSSQANESGLWEIEYRNPATKVGYIMSMQVSLDHESHLTSFSILSDNSGFQAFQAIDILKTTVAASIKEYRFYEQNFIRDMVASLAEKQINDINATDICSLLLALAWEKYKKEHPLKDTAAVSVIPCQRCFL